jgi:hypothetical protein
MQYTNEPAVINRSDELEFLKNWISERPNSLLFVYGPKSSGKTTLLYKFVEERLDKKKYDVKHFNLRKILIVNYRDFLQAFFEIDSTKTKEDVKEKREYNLKVFKLTTEVLKGLNSKELDPFVVMEKELQKLVKKNIRPIIIIDELQALENIYMNGQRELIKELFNFFVAMTKEAHLCHVIIASSDGYFIEKVYNDSKLKKTSKFLEVDYLSKEDVYYWLNNIESESAITSYTLTDSQKEKIWNNFGGSCWEISTFLGDLIGSAKDGKINNANFNSAIEKKLVAARSYFEEYALLYRHKKILFKKINDFIMEKGFFKFSNLDSLINESTYDIETLINELNELVRQNFLYYDSTKAQYRLQGRSMEIGLNMFVEMSGKE